MNKRRVQTDVIKIHQTARNSRRVGWGTREKLEALVYRALPHDYTRAKGAILEVKRRRLIGATRRMRLPARTARFIAPMGCFRLTSMSADGACNVLSSVGRQVRHWPGLNNAWSDCLTLQQSREFSLNIGNFSLFHLCFVIRQYDTNSDVFDCETLFEIIPVTPYRSNPDGVGQWCFSSSSDCPGPLSTTDADQ